MAIMLILGKDTSWSSAKKEMADSNFLDRLKKLNPERDIS